MCWSSHVLISTISRAKSVPRDVIVTVRMFASACALTRNLPGRADTRASSRGGVWRRCRAKPRPDEQKLDMRHRWLDERATNREVHNPSKAMAVDPAGVRQRRSNLPGEVCVVFRVSELGKPRGDPTGRRSQQTA